jgi:hypothetical protein
VGLLGRDTHGSANVLSVRLLRLQIAAAKAFDATMKLLQKVFGWIPWLPPS